MRGIPEHFADVERSREALLAEIGDGYDLTFMHAGGNVGDQLIWAGTRELLRGHIFREIELDELPSSGGDTVLLAGSGAFSRPYHDWMPQALAIAEQRFDRVIVMPSSFDVGEDAVRAALQRTRATIFAREPESLRRIEGFCRARAAHDCAFFYDFSSRRADGEGTLNAFRTDAEATHGLTPPPGNDDISARCETLEEWLDEIERHALVRTDRAHVMIAAALMGKPVEYADGAYHKVGAIAEAALAGHAVRRISSHNGRPAPERAPIAAHARNGDVRVTAAVVTRDRPETALRAARSVAAADVGARVVLLDDNSAPPARAMLQDAAANDGRLAVRAADRTLGVAAGRGLASELARSEYLLLLDDDAELQAGALERLVADLDAHPEAIAVTPLVAGGDGTVRHLGGWPAVSDETVRLALDGAGRRSDDPELPPSGATGWVCGAAVLVRGAALGEIPFDPAIPAPLDDLDWSLRAERARPGCLRRCREAIVVQEAVDDTVWSHGFLRATEVAGRLAGHAAFLRRHGLVLEDELARLVPELRRDGTLDVAAARLLLELVAARGAEWLAGVWQDGGLDPLFDGGEARAGRHAAEMEQLTDALVAERHRVAALEDAAATASEHTADLRTWVADLEAQRDELLGRIAFLDHKAATLAAIEEGRWWRLRGRLLALTGRGRGR
jgi:GT2 family glycosyltransferase